MHNRNCTKPLRGSREFDPSLRLMLRRSVIVCGFW
jgi:hypothetical protein